MTAARLLLLIAFLATGTTLPGATISAQASPARVAALGPIVDVPGGRGEMEVVRIAAPASEALLSTRTGDSVRLDDWPVAPGVRRPVIVSRFDVYAPGARVVRIVAGREVELPRSTLAFFKGETADGGEPARVVTWVDPSLGVRGGMVFDRTDVYELEPDPSPIAAGALRVLRPDARFPQGAPLPRWTCAQEELAEALGAAAPDASAPEATSPTKSAVLSFDTDYEYLSIRFGGNITNLVNYMATLVANTTVIYERDIGPAKDQGVRILQGYSIVRASEAEDPYSDTLGTADSAKLNEFTNYWEANYPRSTVKRALAALLSGRQGSSSSASGIAWVSGLCSGIGYSIDELFGVNYLAGDILILAHEMGHNFGAYHTHNCTYGTPPIDTCLAAEGGCAPQGSCPAPQTINGVTNVTGTLMSYCHLRGDGCTSSLVFHPVSYTGTTASNGIDDDVAAATCLASVGGGVVPPGPSGVSISPTSGPLAGGQAVTITGSGFSAGATVSFVELPSNNVFGGSPNAKALTSVSVVNATTITAVTPSATNTGLVDVVVMNADQQTATLRSGYTYSATAPPPTVTAVSPNSGSTSGGTGVTITGTGFAATPTVRFGGTSATGVTFVSATTLSATTPAHSAGLVSVAVTNPDAQSGTLANGYFYAAAPSATRYYVLTPCRLFDTRASSGATAAAPILAAGETRTFDLSGRCGVPEAAVAVTVNVTVTGSGAAGELRLFPANGVSPNPATTAISFAAGKTRANNGSYLLSTDGTLACKVQNVSSASVHFILDVSGYYLLAP